MASPRLYRLEPLAEAAHLPLQQLGRLLGMSGRSWQLARDQGVGELAADRYAVRLGLHPATVWPEMLDRAIETEGEAQRARLERKREIARESARRRYWEDDALRERKKAAVRSAEASRSRSRRFQPSQSGAIKQQRDRGYYERHREAILARKRAAYAVKKRRGGNEMAQGTDETVAA